jgi:antitoxin MazE
MPAAQIVKWGNSLAVRIPKQVLKDARLAEGNAVEIRVSRGRVELRATERIPTLKELVSQITRENRYPETSWGAERGKEKVEW